MNRTNDLPPFLCEQSVDTSVVIACFEACSKTRKKKTVVVMDNAAVHTSEALEECLPKWKKKGVIITYLPPYSPELNLIEILWRNIKYAWGPFSADQCLNTLRDALEDILKNFGSKYQITFA
jgi:transposase